jgi:hypothetical protein
MQLALRGILAATTLRASMNRIALSDRSHVFVYSSQAVAVAATVLAVLVELRRFWIAHGQQRLTSVASVDDDLQLLSNNAFVD